MRIVWVTLLALVNRDGIVQGSVPGIANVARVSVDKCRAAIDRLLSPDPDSRTATQEGRRIEVIQGGWKLINFEYYRQLHSEEERKDYKRRWMADKRSSPQVSTIVHESPQSPQVDNVDTSRSRSIIRSKSSVGWSAGASPTSDSDWLAELCQNPAYEGIEVMREFEKMKAWACTNKKQPSRRRFINWLNRAEKPISSAGGPTLTRKVGFKEPQGWKAWINHRRSDSPLATGGSNEAHDWVSIAQATQEYIIEGMRKEPIGA